MAPEPGRENHAQDPRVTSKCATTPQRAKLTKKKIHLQFPREVLVIEIDRRCGADRCRARNQISLTRAKAIEYRGFNCSECETWNDDRLTHTEMPESWNEESIN